MDAALSSALRSLFSVGPRGCPSLWGLGQVRDDVSRLVVLGMLAFCCAARAWSTHCLSYRMEEVLAPDELVGSGWVKAG